MVLSDLAGLDTSCISISHLGDGKTTLTYF